MNVFKKMVSFLIIALLFISMFAGCGRQEQSSTTPKTDDKSSTQTDTSSTEKKQEGAPILKKYDPIVTLTTARWVNADLNEKYRDGDTWENNIWTRFIKDTLGIVVKDLWTAPDWGQFEQKLALSIAAGEEFPDYVFDFYNVGNATLQKVMENTPILYGDVREAFNKYASPTVKKAYELAGEDIWTPFTKQSKAYGLPTPNNGLGNANCLYIRKDWLEKTGLGIPKTMDELDNVLAAFKKLNPNNYSIAFGWKDDFTTYISETSWVFGAYGAIPGIWMKDSNGELVFGSVRPEIKQGLAKLREWFEKGYIDPQAAFYNVWEAKDKTFVAEKAGIISGPIWFYWTIKDNLLVNNKDAIVEPMPIPSGPNGKAMRVGYDKLGGVFFFSKNIANMEAFFNYFNTMYEIHNPHNEKFKYGYIEGMDYGIGDDGKPLYGDDMKNSSKYPKGRYDGWDQFVLGYNNATTMPYKEFEAYVNLSKGLKPSNPFEEKLSKDPELIKNSAVAIYSQKDAGLINAYFGPAPSNAAAWDQLKKKEMLVFTKIIYGQEPLDAFDKFVKEWYAQGGEEITKEVNAWYKANVKK